MKHHTEITLQAQEICDEWLNGNRTDAMERLLAITQFNHSEGLQTMIHIALCVTARDLAQMRTLLERIQHA